MADADTRKGRPRPLSVIERDDKVIALLKDGSKTSKELADALGVKRGIAYLSLYRLQRDKRVESKRADGGRILWSLV